MDAKQMMDRRVRFLQGAADKLFADKIAMIFEPGSEPGTIDVLTYGTDGASYGVSFGDCDGSGDRKAAIYAWRYDGGDRETPPDYAEDELGTVETWDLAGVVGAIAKDLASGVIESLAEVDSRDAWEPDPDHS